MHSKYLQLKKNCENISKSQHSRDKLARKWLKKTLGNEKKPVYKYIPDYLWAWYNIEKESNHQKKKKKRKKSFKMKFKKTKQKNSKLPGTGSAPSLGARFHDTMLNPQSCRKIAMKLRANLSQFVSSQQRNVRIKCANILREEVFWI